MSCVADLPKFKSLVLNYGRERNTDALEGSVRQQAVQGNAPRITHVVTVPAAEDNRVLTDEYVVSPEIAMFDTMAGLSDIPEQPFLNSILHTGPSPATVPDIDFSWNSGPPSSGLISPLISPTMHFDTYITSDQTVSLGRRASIASETQAEEGPGQPQVSRLVQADLYV